MSELIEEYGKIFLAVMAGVLVIGVLAYAYKSISAYMEFYADQLMGGTI